MTPTLHVAPMGSDFVVYTLKKDSERLLSCQPCHVWMLEDRMTFHATQCFNQLGQDNKLFTCPSQRFVDTVGHTKTQNSQNRSINAGFVKYKTFL